MHQILFQRIITLFTFFSCLALYGQEGNRCRVFGTVRDSEGGTLPLVSIGSSEGARALTDLSGRYSVMVKSGKEIRLTFSMIGYETIRRRFTPSGDSLRIDVTLPPYGAATLGEAVVKGQGVQTSMTGKISKESLDQMPSTTGNGVEELIATQAGVSTHSELSSQYNVRGGSFDENCVYINGFEIYRPMLVRSGQQEGLSAINPDMVERIDFSTGGFEAKYGDVMSSVLDITYRRPRKTEARASASLLGASAYVGTGGKNYSLMGSARYKTTRHLLSSLETTGEYRPRFADYQFAATWQPSAALTLEAMGGISDNRYNFVPEDRETKFGTMENAKSFKVYFDGEEEDAFKTLTGATRVTLQISPVTQISAHGSAFSTREKETYDIGGEYWLSDAGIQEQIGVGTYIEHARSRLRAVVYRYGLDFRTRISTHNIAAGISMRHEHSREFAKEWEMRDSSGYSLPHDPERLELIYSLRSENELRSTRFEAYARDLWRIKNTAGWWTVNYGMRLTHIDRSGETLFSPRVSIGWLPEQAPRLTLRAAAGVYYGVPFYKEMRQPVTDDTGTHIRLNRDLRSQRSIHFVAGGDYTFRAFSRPMRFTAEAYYKHLSHLIPYSVEGLRIVYSGLNEGKGYATGIDLKLFGEFVPGTDSWVTFSLMKTSEKINGVWLPRPTDQRYNLSLFFTDYIPGTERFRFTLKAALADGLPFGPPHSEREKHVFRAPPYRRVDAGMSYRLAGSDTPHRKTRVARLVKNAWIGIDVFNLLGINNVNSYYWVTDVTNTRYAVPNYLTGRLINLRLSVEL